MNFKSRIKNVLLFLIIFSIYKLYSASQFNFLKNFNYREVLEQLKDESSLSFSNFSSFSTLINEVEIKDNNIKQTSNFCEGNELQNAEIKISSSVSFEEKLEDQKEISILYSNNPVIKDINNIYINDLYLDTELLEDIFEDVDFKLFENEIELINYLKNRSFDDLIEECKNLECLFDEFELNNLENRNYKINYSLKINFKDLFDNMDLFEVDFNLPVINYEINIKETNCSILKNDKNLFGNFEPEYNKLELFYDTSLNAISLKSENISINNNLENVFGSVKTSEFTNQLYINNISFEKMFRKCKKIRKIFESYRLRLLKLISRRSFKTDLNIEGLFGEIDFDSSFLNINCANISKLFNEYKLQKLKIINNEKFRLYVSISDLFNKPKLKK